MRTRQDDLPLPPTDLAACVGDCFAENPAWSCLHAGRRFELRLNGVVHTNWS